MTVYESTSVLTAVISFVLFGALAGGIYPSVNTLRSFILYLLTLPKDALCADKRKIPERRTRRLGQVLLNISDFVYFIIIGLIYVLFTYICFDMEIRIYPLLIFLVAFFLSKRYLGSYLGKLIRSIFDRIYRTLFVLLFYLSRPLRNLFLFSLSLVKPIYIKAIRRARLKRIKRTMASRERELSRFLKS